MYSLENQWALVTGGGRGIGRGVSLQIAAARANVAVTYAVDGEKDEAELVAAGIRDKGRRALTAQMDITDTTSIAAGIESIFAQAPRIDILVNNAGVMQRTSGISTGTTDFDLCFLVNVKGLWQVTQALLPHFLERREGKIVNVASTAGRIGVAETPAYNASKAAVINITQSMAKALGAHNINVNAVCPGLVRTPMSEKYAKLLTGTDAASHIDIDAWFASIIEQQTLHRHVTPEDIGNAVVFLASAHASSITGQALNVDGGFLMH